MDVPLLYRRRLDASLQPVVITGTPPVATTVPVGETASGALVSWGVYQAADGYTLTAPVREMNNGWGWVPYNPNEFLEEGPFQLRETLSTVEDATITRTFWSAIVQVVGDTPANAAMWGDDPALWGNQTALWGEEE